MTKNGRPVGPPVLRRAWGNQALPVRIHLILGMACHDDARINGEFVGLMRTRLFILTASGGLALLGLSAGVLSLAQGGIDQAIALSWPGIGAALALMLAMPGRAGE